MLSKESFIIRPVHDIGFKALFGHKSDPECILLKDLLETIFNTDFDVIEFKDREITGEEVQNKSIHLDLRVYSKGHYYNIEMQMKTDKYSAERFLFYASASISDQNLKGKSYGEMIPVHQVVLYADDGPAYALPFDRFFLLSHQSFTHMGLTPKLDFTMISLKRVVEEITDYSTMNNLQKWALFLLHQHEKDHEGIQYLLHEDRFRKADEIMKLINQDKTLKYSAFQKMKDEMDQKTREHSAREEGIEQGLAQGREEGIEQGLAQGREEGIEQGLVKGRELQAIKTAFNLFQYGFDNSFICEMTQLSLEKVIELRQQFDSGIMMIHEKTY